MARRGSNGGEYLGPEKVRDDLGARAWAAGAVAAAAPRAFRRTIERVARATARDFRDNLKKGALRFYDAAAGGRNTANWRTTGASANAEVAIAGPELRNRSRDLDRNNPTAHKILSAFVNNSIGSGILIKFDDPAVQAIWDVWITECDTAHNLDFYGLQWLMVYGAILSGEALARKRPRMMRDGLSVPLQVQLLESDYLASIENRMLPDGGRLVQGIEFDPIDRRRAYWLYPYHPGDAFGPLGVPGFVPVRIPAEDVIHMFEATRAGQTRGVPLLTPIMRVVKDLHEYDFAHLTNKRAQANVCAVVYGDDPEEPGMAPELSFAGSDDPVEGLESGAIIIARGGKQIAFNNPTQTGGYAEFKRDRKHDIAAGALTPFELATGDLSQVNYSSIRAGLIEYRRMITSYRNRVIIPLFIKPIVGWFLDAAIAAGKIKPGRYGYTCNAPKFEEVDRLKEALANRQRLENGETSLTQINLDNGDDPAAVLAQRKADRLAAIAAGLPEPGKAVAVAVAETAA